MPYALFPTAFGACGVAWNGVLLTAFQLPEATPLVMEKSGGAAPAAPWREAPPPTWVGDIIARVQRHFAGHPQDFAEAPLDWSRVSPFQCAVYRQAWAIKPGFKRSYGDIARELGLGPEGSRAVGVALGANPWPLLVPCHRVVSATGKMTGFSAPGGIRTKTRLLALEGAELLSE